MSSLSSGTTPTGTGLPPIVDYGVGSGLNTQAIIAAELQPFEAPERQLQVEQATLKSQVSDYQQVNSDLLTLQTQAMQLALPSGWQARQATSSDPSVTATAAAGTPAGTVQFSVLGLASASSLISSGSVSSTSQVVTQAPSLLLAEGSSRLGLATLTGSGLSLGTHTVQVTQSSAAASTTGTVDLAAQTGGIAIGSGADTLNVSVDGTAYTLTLAASPSGGYSGTGLLSALQSAISAAGASGVLQAGYGSNGNLVLSTTHQGSSQSLQVTGGDGALAALGLSAMPSAATGVDGVVSVDGTSTTLTDIAPGGTLTLAGPSGASITATAAAATPQVQAGGSLLTDGTLTATNVSTGNGSLADVVANINQANAGVIASAIQTGTNQYVLQLTSSTTGSDANVSVAPGTFAGSSLGTLQVASSGSDARIQIGGSGGYTLSSPTDTFSGLLPGLDVTVGAVTSSPVTVAVSPDATAMAKQVQTLVDDANTVLADVQSYAGYNAATKTGGPLMGAPDLQSVTNRIEAVFASVEGTSSLGNARSVGITLSDGKLQFDQSTFTSAYDANPAQVAALFTQGSTFSPTSSGYAGQVSLSYASNTTKAGTYDVAVTQSAAQASDVGAALTSGTVSSAEQLTFTAGGSTAQYATTAGESLASVAAGINQAFAASGLQLSAQVVAGGTQLQVTSAAYGSAASFSVSTTNAGAGSTGLAGSGNATFSGADVAGTINGVAATGSGQFLDAPSSDPTLAGLSLLVTTPGITSSTDLGQLTYTQGVAQALATLGTAMADPADGAITQTINGLSGEAAGLTSQIQFYANIVAQEQKLLTNKYAALDATIASLQSQGATLAGQLAQLAGTSSGSSSSTSSLP